MVTSLFRSGTNFAVSHSEASICVVWDVFNGVELPK